MTKENIERWWLAVQKHADTITLTALCDMVRALDLRLNVKRVEGEENGKG